MLYHSVDRGVSLGKSRRDGLLTDVILVCDNQEIHAHKLILSLHSFYFRTLFQSSGFSESNCDKINMSSLDFYVLESMVDYMYTGKLELEPPGDPLDLDDLDNEELILELLQAETFLQLNDEELRSDLEGYLVSTLTCRRDSARTVLRMGQYASIFQLPSLQYLVLSILDINLSMFLQDKECQDILLNLDSQELSSILSQPNLCVPSDSILLDWILRWSEHKTSCKEDNLINLLQKLYLDRKFIQKKTDKLYPQSNLSSKLILPKTRLRECPKYYYLVEFKLHKLQLRNIEDFVDKGEKSNFYSFSLPDGSINKVSILSSISTMAGTCNANYFRPLTQGSHLHHKNGKLVVLGGLEDVSKDTPASRHRNVRKDILEYDLNGKVWLPPAKKTFQSSKQYKRISVQSIDCARDEAFVLFSGQNSEHDEVHLFLDKVGINSNDIPFNQGKVTLLSNLPDWFTLPCSIMYDGRSSVYVCGTKGFARYSLDSQSWDKLPPPIGDVGGESKVWLCGVADEIYLLTGKPQSGSPSITNSLQVYDVETGRWRLICNTGLRFTPTSFTLHSGALLVAGWCPAKNNFLITVDPDTATITELGSGVEGIMSRGIVLHQYEMKHFFGIN